MRFLSIHNRYVFPGGEDVSCATEDRLLEAAGHKVFRYRQDNRKILLCSRPGIPLLALKTMWNVSEYRRIRLAIRRCRPDIVDVHNFFPLISPAVHYAAAAEGVPSVQTLHNYRLLCPNGLFYQKGKVCKKCQHCWHFLPAIRHACYRHSRAATTAVVAMILLHRFARTWTRRVGHFVVLSEFQKETFVEAGFPRERMTVKPNCIVPDPLPGPEEGRKYAIYVGRLSPEKGLGTVARAWRQQKNSLNLKIIGAGQQEDELRANFAGCSGVEFLGTQPPEKAYELIGKAAFLLFPTECFETFGRVVVEAYAKATPVIASRSGAVVEMVQEGKTGLLFTPGNAAELTTRIEWAVANPVLMRQMGQRARREFELKYTGARNYERMMAIYEAARQSRFHSA